MPPEEVFLNPLISPGWMPIVFTAASVSTVMVMAAPAMLIVAPSGIEIE